jgi:parallel beta-helix repeat protein
MQGLFYRKSCTVAIVVLLIGISIAPSISSDEPVSKDMLFVDDDADPSWYDATHVKTIQEGIDNATAGGTVYVYNGTYFENVVIDKSINLVGEDRATTIIDGSEKLKVVYVTSDSVNISEFTIQNSSYMGVGFGIHLYHVDNCRIYNNIVIDNFEGVTLAYSSDNFIIKNNLSLNYCYGIRLFENCMNNFINNNDVYFNKFDGIEILNSNSNIIDNNTFFNNSEAGIRLRASGDDTDYNNIENNRIGKNNVGIQINRGNENRFIGNSFFKNKYGINILENSINNIIYHNNFINNTISAYDFSSNSWYNSLLSCGNYWSDYNGTDNDNDGIGDVPYFIDGSGNSIDAYPLMYPYNRMPNTPIIDGPTSGKPGIEYEYEIYIQDPDGDDIDYCTDWDDGFVPRYNGWYAPSPLTLKFNHSWVSEGTYTIRAKAMDIHGAESDWATLEVSMPKNKAININSLFLRFLENHPNMFPILRYILEP